MSDITLEAAKKRIAELERENADLRARVEFAKYSSDYAERLLNKERERGDRLERENAALKEELSGAIDVALEYKESSGKLATKCQSLQTHVSTLTAQRNDARRAIDEFYKERDSVAAKNAALERIFEAVSEYHAAYKELCRVDGEDRDADGMLLVWNQDKASRLDILSLRAQEAERKNRPTHPTETQRREQRKRLRN